MKASTGRTVLGETRVKGKKRNSRRLQSRTAKKDVSVNRKWRITALAIKIVGLVTAAGFLLGGGWLLGMFLVYGSDPDLPRIKGVKDYSPLQVTRVFSRDGRLIGEIFEERRTVVGLDKMPRHLINAAIAAEDSRFFEHKGLDKMGMVRAFLANLRAGKYVQGGSTITQQVVKTLFLSPERTMKRKVQELILARRLEQALTKEEILGIYLNQIYYGHGRYGVGEAARYFFNKDVSDLALEEAALLAGLPQSPAGLSPIRHPEAARKRRKYVLGRMAHMGFIEPAEAEKLSAEPIRLDLSAGDDIGKCPEIFTEVRRRLTLRFGKKVLNRLGLDVITSCDLKLQAFAENSVRDGLTNLERRWLRNQKRYPEKQWPRIYKHWQKTRKSSFGKGDVVRALVVKGLDDGGAALNLDEKVTAKLRPVPGFKKTKKFAGLQRGQVLTVVLEDTDEEGFDYAAQWKGPQAALAAVDVRTRHVKAMVGGRNFRRGDFNRALHSRRQPGSAFKPIVYTAALSTGRYTPASLLPDAPEVFRLWKPRNAGRREFMGPVRLRSALAVSLNTVAIKLLSEVGIENVHETARKMGIKSRLTADLSLALGSSGVTVLEITNSMTTLAAGGLYEEPEFIIRIGDRNMGDDKTKKRVLDENVAYVMTDMMTSVIREGTGARAAGLKRPAAGKTGTTNNSRDGWFLGFTPQLTTGVWVGFDDYLESLGPGESGGRTALPIWLDFMQNALQGQAVEEFVQPQGVVVRRIDPKSGLLATADMKDAILEVFVEGTDPKESAPSIEDIDPADLLLLGNDS